MSSASAGQSAAADVLIIGAGVVGCSIARALSRRGLATLNVDALPAAGYGSTSHSTAIVRPFYSHATSCALAHESRGHWLRWPEWLELPATGRARYHECGGLVLVPEGQEADFADNLAALDAVGVPYRWLDGAGVTALYPGMDLRRYGPPRRQEDPGFGEPAAGRIAGGIYLPAAGFVDDPALATRDLAEAARRTGARFRFRAGVQAILQASGRVVGVALADGERLYAGAVVNAAGPHSARINALAGLADTPGIATRALRHEVAWVRAPADYLQHGNGFIADLDAGVYARAHGDDLVIGSVDPACDPEDVVDPDDYADSFSEQWTLQVMRAAQRFPALGLETPARGTVGLYDVSSDWCPIYDRSDLDGFYLAIGTSGNQFKNAPLIGEVMAAVMDAGRTHDGNPARLRLSTIGQSIDLGFFSRRREPRATASVLA